MNNLSFNKNLKTKHKVIYFYYIPKIHKIQRIIYHYQRQCIMQFVWFSVHFVEMQHGVGHLLNSSNERKCQGHFKQIPVHSKGKSKVELYYFYVCSLINWHI